MHVDHPKQDHQVLSMSKTEQEMEEPEIVDGVRTLRPLPFNIDLEEIPSLSIQRCSPLICVNDDIVRSQISRLSPSGKVDSIIFADQCHQANLP